MSVVGIDFGTLNCVISQAKRGGIDTVLNEGSKRQTAGIVSFQGKQRFMGEQAVPLVSSNYKNTVVQVKRFVGRSWSDPQVQADIAVLPNRDAFQELDGDRIGIQVNYQDEMMVMTPEDVCAMLMGSLVRTAEFANDNRKVNDVVFSVPAFWTDRQRRAFLAAARIADVNVLGLINDGTATALSYGIWKSAGNQFDAEKKEHVMFVDMGYASLQVTIAAFVQGKLQVVASASDETLGGRDIDMLLAKHFAAQFNDKYKADPMTSPKALLKLLKGCEKAKQTLTPEGVSMANINVEYLMNETDFNSKLTLEEFDELIEPIVERVQAPLERAIEESGLSVGDLSAVEIVGGSTRIRAIKKRISKVLGLDETKPNYGLATTQNADECVSRGCALRCAMLSPAFRVKEFVVSDSVKYPVTVSWEAVPPAELDEDAMEEDDTAATGNNVKLLERGVETPRTRRILFRRSEPFEISAAYDAECKGEFSNPEDMHIGSFRISGMPEKAASEDSLPRIRVDFTQDEFGLFRVSRADLMQEVAPEPAADAEEGAAAADDGEAAKADGEGKEEASAADAAAAEGKEGKEQGEKGEEDKPKKKKFKPFKLTVESHYRMGHAEEDLLSAKSREQEFRAHDQVLRETSEMKNKLEAYVYSMRDQIDYALKEFGTEDERSAFASSLQDAENWLYEEGFEESKAVYTEKLKSLQAKGDVFVKRQAENENRPKAAERLRDEISANLGVINSPDEKYAHLSEEERAKVRECCEDAEKWLEEKLAEQADKNLHEDPVVTVADIEAQTKDVHQTCRPVVTKPKPKPAKKAEPEAKEAKEAEGAAAAGEEDAANAEPDAADADADAAEGEKAKEGKEENDMDVD